VLQAGLVELPGQGVGWVLDCGQNEFGGHWVQASELEAPTILPYVPAKQEVQVEEATWREYVPGMHCAQVEFSGIPSPVEKVPDKHCVQTVAPTPVEYVPFVHCFITALMGQKYPAGGLHMQFHDPLVETVYAGHAVHTPINEKVFSGHWVHLDLEKSFP
jgi:hypothetical protein